MWKLRWRGNKNQKILSRKRAWNMFCSALDTISLKSEVVFKYVDNIRWLSQKLEKEMPLSRKVHSWSHAIMSESSLKMKRRRLTFSYKNFGQFLQVANLFFVFVHTYFRPKKVEISSKLVDDNRGKKCVINVARKFQNSNTQFFFFFIQAKTFRSTRS